MFCAVTADLARYEREVDRDEALEAAVEREEAVIYHDADLLLEVLTNAVMRTEAIQLPERTTAGARWPSGSGINIAFTTHNTAVSGLAEVFRILVSAEVTSDGYASSASGEELIVMIDRAKEFVVGVVRDAAKVRVEEGRNLAEQDQDDMRGAE